MECRLKRTSPQQCALEWIAKECDPPGFRVAEFPVDLKGRGIVTTTSRLKGDFLLVYKGELISADEGEIREEADGGTGYRFFSTWKGKPFWLMTNEFMSRWNMNGNKGKLSFQKSAVFQVVLESSSKIFPETETMKKFEIGTCLKYAPDRRGGGGRKKLDA